MSGKCANCDCADSSKCVKQGNQNGVAIIENEKFEIESMIVEEGGNCQGCQCGAGCACVSCSCCSH